MGNKLSQELCKKERDILSKMLDKKINSQFKKCGKINDQKEKTKCYNEEDKKYYKTAIGKKHLQMKKEVNKCYKREIKNRGCIEKKAEYDKTAKKLGKEWDEYIKLLKKMNKKCGKIEDKEEQKKCGKKFDKEIKYFHKYFKSNELKKIDKDYKKAQKSFYKCMDKSK